MLVFRVSGWEYTANVIPGTREQPAENSVVTGDTQIASCTLLCVTPTVRV